MGCITPKWDGSGLVISPLQPYFFPIRHCTHAVHLCCILYLEHSLQVLSFPLWDPVIKYRFFGQLKLLPVFSLYFFKKKVCRSLTVFFFKLGSVSGFYKIKSNPETSRFKIPRKLDFSFIMDWDIFELYKLYINCLKLKKKQKKN